MPLTDQVTTVSVVPLTVAVKACEPPATCKVALGGAMVTAMFEFGWVTRRLRLFEGAEPGFGLTTVIGTLPTSLTVVVMVAVSCVEETNEVVTGWPPTLMTAPLKNDDPVTVR